MDDQRDFVLRPIDVPAPSLATARARRRLYEFYLYFDD
jgi:hypothetical protein